MNKDNTALVLGDLQNDFIHPDGAYGRARQSDPAIAALPEAPRAARCALHATRESSSSRHCSPWCRDAAANRSSRRISRRCAPFLKKGDFAPGSWGQQVVEPLAPADVTIEKIAYSAFHASRLEWVLKKCGIEHLYVTGIVTNGGVASTVRDAHVREFHCTVIEDGCAAFGKVRCMTPRSRG